jgi:hypothetical protein
VPLKFKGGFMELCFRGCQLEAKYWDKKNRGMCSKSPNSCPIVKEKQKETCLKRFGSSRPLGNKEVLRKMQNKLIEEYGTKVTKHVGKIRKEENNGKSTEEIRKERCFSKYGVSHYSKTDEFKQKYKETSLKKFGVDHPFKAEEVKEKVRLSMKRNSEDPAKVIETRRKAVETNLERYGVINAGCSELVKEKMRKTCLAKYGVEAALASPNLQEKIRNILLEKYGVYSPFQKGPIREKFMEKHLIDHGATWPMQLPECREKFRLTCIKRYGVPYPAQNSVEYKRYEKLCYKKKDFILPSGRIISLQGYEPLILKDLLKQGLKEEDFEFDRIKIPKFRYYNPIQKRIATYYPDFYIPRLNWIIEVKSTFSLIGNGRKLWEINKAKREAVRKEGFSFNFIVR